MGELIDALEELNKKDIYPFHMPGHKRQAEWIINPYKYDISEISGFDDLHNAKEMLKKLQERLALIYKCKYACLSVNGSTCGILAGIFSVIDNGDTILISRNCHKAVYNGIFLRKANAEYIYPQLDATTGITLDINPRSVENLLRQNRNIKAVVITSPTYEGVISDIEAIADVVHKYGGILIVDAAHGAHIFPDKESKADIIVMSLHKTLPSFTQTAVVCVNNSMLFENVRGYINIFETSSPSYLFMAGVEACLDYIEKDGCFFEYNNRIKEIRNNLLNLQKLKLFQPECRFDEAKLVIDTSGCDINGVELKNLLLNKYNIELEMATEKYALAMTSCMDTEEGFFRLYRALMEIDENINFCDLTEYEEIKNNSAKYQAWECEKAIKTEAYLCEAEGLICGDFVYAYPPGIPILVPGEIISKDIVDDIFNRYNSGVEIVGLKDGKLIKVIQEK